MLGGGSGWFVERFKFSTQPSQINHFLLSMQHCWYLLYCMLSSQIYIVFTHHNTILHFTLYHNNTVNIRPSDIFTASQCTNKWNIRRVQNFPDIATFSLFQPPGHGCVCINGYGPEKSLCRRGYPFQPNTSLLSAVHIYIISISMGGGWVEASV